MTALVGHEYAWRAWRAALASDRMPHGWLLAGPAGLGKARFAGAAAAAWVAEAGLTQPRIAAHPDILILSPAPDGEEEARKHDEGRPFRTKRNITIEQVRRMQSRLTTRPTLGRRRAIIIDAADELENGATNALLKSLEEPPRGTVFLLVAHRPGRLLATVRSRARPLRFAPLADDAMDAIIQSGAPEADAATRSAAIAAARGAPGVALDFVRRDLGAAFTILRDLLIHGDADLSLGAALAASLGPRPERERLLGLLDLGLVLLSDGVAGAGRARQAAIIAAHADLAALAARAPTYNFDPGLLLLEIGRLLASTAMATSAARRD